MNDFSSLLTDGIKEIKATNNLTALEEIRLKYISKNGLISSLMNKIKDIIPADRREFGALINNLKNNFTLEFKQHKDQLELALIQQKLLNEKIDISLHANTISCGSLHPITYAAHELSQIFLSMGFAIAEGPEIENDYYNFQALNIPPHHPARAMQDTFYTTGGNLLRTHTSPVQIRYAEKNSPPIKVISLGRVYRVDMDATHAPMFHQMEGLWIDRNINFANLKYIMSEFLRLYFADPKLEIRFRASFFPFTQASAEIDIKTKDGKWLETIGCGMVHPNVLKAMNISSTEYSGFAFGAGIDRFAMLKYGINDLRMMFGHELDFLQQFTG